MTTQPGSNPPTTQTWRQNATQTAKKAGRTLSRWFFILVCIMAVLAFGWFMFNNWKGDLRQEGQQAADNVWAQCIASLEDCPDADIRQKLNEFSNARYDTGRVSMEEEIVTCLNERAGVGCPQEVQNSLDNLLRDAASTARNQVMANSQTEIEIEVWNQAALYLAGEISEDELPPAALIFIREVENSD